MRPSRNDVLMEIAAVIARRSTCSRLAVGCVFALDGRILVTGYNGAPSSLPHCQHESDEPCTTAEHAERNAIAFAARHGVQLEGSTLYVTHSPCLPCAMAIVNCGVREVIYGIAYRLTDGIELLSQAGIQSTLWNWVDSI